MLGCGGNLVHRQGSVLRMEVLPPKATGHGSGFRHVVLFLSKVCFQLLKGTSPKVTFSLPGLMHNQCLVNTGLWKSNLLASVWHLWRALWVLEIPVGVDKAFVVTVSQLNISFCPILLPSFPQELILRAFPSKFPACKSLSCISLGSLTCGSVCLLLL